MRSLHVLGLCLAFLAATLLSAAAARETGSHGWSLAPLTLVDGPGPAYAPTGTIAAATAIRILRCQRIWCLVDGSGSRGWTHKARIGFGQAPRAPLSGPRLDYPAGGPGSVCFYTGANYTGTALCARSGQVFTDLARYGMDNAFSSVAVEGNVSAAVCRDRQLQSYCLRITQSQPLLDRYLRRNLSSIRVY